MIRNDYLKNTWLNKCQKIEAAGILCGDRAWRFCDSKAVSFTYIILGLKGQRIFGSQETTVQFDEITAKALWGNLDTFFTKQRK